ncbi:hypothetical protein PYW08_002320 [Mythimna loreyi]|uniref:Uncharacterized protein n=1 Tax=Mythimna loreyi TaxID=667449 RepID=A0ACC2R454_9NEOP|nr:hypothetical protein PYW08_002320 [Mythimna loreyi]
MTQTWKYCTKMFGKTILLLLLLTQDSVKSLRLVDLRVPSHEREGGKVRLGCQYDLQEDKLYAVKWYKDGEEFYRYVPRDIPNAYYFHVDGVKVDIERSSNNAVTLINLTQESSGNYSCEVDSDAPYFSVEVRSKYMHIHFLPKTRPRVKGLKELYNLNELVAANCSLGPSRPNAHLVWFVNDRPAPVSYVSGPWHRVSAERPDAAETILQLSFTATETNFINGAIKLKCQATIAPLYQKEKESTHYIALPIIEEKEIKDA